MDRANVLGIGVHAIDLPSAVSIVEDAVRGGMKGYVCVTSVRRKVIPSIATFSTKPFSSPLMVQHQVGTENALHRRVPLDASDPNCCRTSICGAIYQRRSKQV